MLQMKLMKVKQESERAGLKLKIQETERDGVKEQTLKKCILQGKIRLTVNIKKFFKR